MKENIDIVKFIKVCNESESMSKACATLGLHFNTFKRLAIKYNCYKTNQSGKRIHKNNNGSNIPIDEILEGKHPQYQTYKLKNKLIKAGIKENKCEICGISEWNGKPIKMELHHIDGDRTNHKLSNLMMLCPNCHSQTETFRARNIKNHS